MIHCLLVLYIAHRPRSHRAGANTTQGFTCARVARHAIGCPNTSAIRPLPIRRAEAPARAYGCFGGHRVGQLNPISASIVQSYLPRDLSVEGSLLDNGFA